MTWLGKTIAVAATLAVALPVAPAAGVLTVPRYILSVRNTTSMALTCRVQVDGNAAETLLITPGQEWQRRVTRTTAVASMSCAAPVRAVLFKLAPGRRYVLLRGGKDSTVDLRDVSGGV